jgi:hypothetical protein
MYKIADILSTNFDIAWFNQILIEREEATPAGVLAGVAQAREDMDPVIGP